MISDETPRPRFPGIFDYETLATLATSERDYRIDKLVPDKSICLLVGDSGLGKTALSITQGIAIASGQSFLGLVVKQGKVLYCDAESGLPQFVRSVGAISKFAGLAEPPAEFYTWSPNFDPRTPSGDVTPGDLLCEQVKTLRPDHVIVDPLRAFWPEAEDNSRDAMKMIGTLRTLSKELGCSWMLNHHRRKRNPQHAAQLERDRHTWFEEAAGSLALVNGSDTRLGVESSRARGDLVLAGFVRSVGWLGALALERVYDDDGEPQGYQVLKGVNCLNDRYREVFAKLEPRFRFKDVHAALGASSASNATELIKQCITLGLMRKEGTYYLKVE